MKLSERVKLARSGALAFALAIVVSAIVLAGIAEVASKTEGWDGNPEGGKMRIPIVFLGAV